MRFEDFFKVFGNQLVAMVIFSFLTNEHIAIMINGLLEQTKHSIFDIKIIEVLLNVLIPYHEHPHYLMSSYVIKNISLDKKQSTNRWLWTPEKFLKRISNMLSQLEQGKPNKIHTAIISLELGFLEKNHLSQIFSQLVGVAGPPLIVSHRTNHKCDLRKSRFQYDPAFSEMKEFFFTETPERKKEIMEMITTIANKHRNLFLINDLYGENSLCFLLKIFLTLPKEMREAYRFVDEMITIKYTYEKGFDINSIKSEKIPHEHLIEILMFVSNQISDVYSKKKGKFPFGSFLKMLNQIQPFIYGSFKDLTYNQKDILKYGISPELFDSKLDFYKYDYKACNIILDGIVINLKNGHKIVYNTKPEKNPFIMDLKRNLPAYFIPFIEKCSGMFSESFLYTKH